jgi:hypothetical protein
MICCGLTLLHAQSVHRTTNAKSQTALQTHGAWLFIYYRAPRARYEAVATTDWKHWQDITAQTSLPPFSKHSSFLHITDDEAVRLLARHDATASPTPNPPTN